MFFTGRMNTTNRRTTSLIQSVQNALTNKSSKSIVLAASLTICGGVALNITVTDSRLNHTIDDKTLTANVTVPAEVVKTTPTTVADDEALANNTRSYIVRAQDFEQLQNTLAKMNILPTHQLHVINSLAVELTQAQLSELEQKLDVSVSINHQVQTASNFNTNQGVGGGQLQFQPEAVIADFVNVQQSHYNGQYGAGVTIGFIDTGLDHFDGNALDTYGYDKYWGTYDAINNVSYNYLREQNGHGTHVTSIAGNSEQDMYGRMYGVAPNALTVGIKAFDSLGQGSYADVIRGIQWGIDNKDTINLRVLNLSFSGPVQSYYWEDPLNQAIMTAWQAGIVIVASAGNRGPEPMTIGVPGNVPYVITVGAMTDSYTPTDSSDDKLAIFSSTGPTIEGFVKPEIIAPGGHLSGLMASDTYIVETHPEFHNGGGYFQMSGTSQAAAVISGAAAMLLSQDPTLSPDDVKCRIIASARAGLDSNSNLTYSVFQQGAGVIDVGAALASNASGCANVGLDIAADLAGTAHYKGPAKMDSKGDFYIEGTGDQYLWDIPTSLSGSEAESWKASILNETTNTWTPLDSSGGVIWHVDSVMGQSQLEQTAFETDTSFLWEQQALGVNGGIVWHAEVNMATPIEVNAWVEQQ